MNNTGYRLVVGDKNYSSWSLRPWLLMRAFEIEFEEINVDINTPGTRKRILEHSPSGKVPALIAGELTIWDTLAIFEYLAEAHAGLAIWPEDREARAIARAVSAEMHSGFDALRNEMPMDFIGSKPGMDVSKGVAHDITRIVDIWRMCRETHASSNSEAVGPAKASGESFLFGDFSAADAMFAPVTSRFRTYGVDLAAHGDDGAAQSYCETLLAHRAIVEWTQGGEQEISQRGKAF